MDLLTDLDNDGVIGGADSGLRETALESGASDEDKDKGTEFLFLNDQISNGLWDKEDSDPDKPADEKDDDDAQEIKIVPGITEGEVWLEHPAIAGLSFYKTRECNAGDKVNLSPDNKFSVSAQNPFPDQLFVRADGQLNFPADNPQIEGELVLKIKVGGADGQEIEALKMKFTVVKEIGAKKYFHATRDYILENNTTLYVDDRGFPSDNPTSTIRICSMLEEQTEMNPFESYHDDARENWIQDGMLAGAPFEPDKFTAFGLGISGAMASDPESTVVINGNQCDFTDTSLPSPFGPLGNVHRLTTLSLLSLSGEAHLTDRCHGRIHTIPPGWPISRKNASSSDHDDPNTLVPGTHFRGSYLAGDDPITGTALAGGKYFTQYTDGSFQMDAGRVPAAGFGNAIQGAIGGLSGNYSDGERNNFPNSFVGHHLMDEHGESGKGVVFVAMGKARPLTPLEEAAGEPTGGDGKVVEFYEAAKSSGVPEIPGATGDSAGKPIIKLLMLDSGKTSCALAHKNPANDFIKVYEGEKHQGAPYYTNTFLKFKASKPRQ